MADRPQKSDASNRRRHFRVPFTHHIPGDLYFWEIKGIPSPFQKPLQMMIEDASISGIKFSCSHQLPVSEQIPPHGVHRCVYRVQFSIQDYVYEAIGYIRWIQMPSEEFLKQIERAKQDSSSLLVESMLYPYSYGMELQFRDDDSIRRFFRFLNQLDIQLKKGLKRGMYEPIAMSLQAIPQTAKKTVNLRKKR